MSGETLSAKPLLRVLAGEALDPPPVWFMRQAGRYLPEYREVRSRVPDFLTVCYTPEIACELVMQPLRRFELDAAILFSDILVLPDALGVEVRFVEGQGPVLRTVETEDEVRRLADRAWEPHLAPVFACVERLRGMLPPHCALIGFSGAPWTLAAYMLEGRGSRDFAKARTALFARPELVGGLMELLTERVADYVCRQVEAGAEVIQLFDSWAGVLPASSMDQMVLRPARSIVRRLRERGHDAPVILFARGVGAFNIELARGAGVDGLGLDSGVPLGWAARAVSPAGSPALQGNLDPLKLLGARTRLRAEVDEIRATMVGRPFIFNLGHGIVLDTPPDAVAEVISHLKRSRV